MELSLNFERQEGIPWGFRFLGGAGSGAPLTVVQVVQDGIGETYGLMPGDVILNINDIDASNLTCEEAEKYISESQQFINLRIKRESLSNIQKDDLYEEIINEEIDNILKRFNSQSDEEKFSNINIKNNQQPKKQEDDLNLTDEEILSIITPETQNRKYSREDARQVNGDNKNTKMAQINEMDFSDKNLKEDIAYVENVGGQKRQDNNIELNLSQNFQSNHDEILKAIDFDIQNEHEICRKWSTFLQKPTNAKPHVEKKFQQMKQAYRVKIRTKKELEAERELKRKIEMEVLEKELREVQTLISAEYEQDMIIAAYLFEEMEQERLAFEMEQERIAYEMEQERISYEMEMRESEEGNIKETDLDNDENYDVKEYSECSTLSAQKVVLTLEQQLSQVKEQLLCLSDLPITIQSTLSQITEQLQKLSEETIPMIKEETEEEVLNEALNRTSDFEDAENTLDSLEILSADEEENEILDNIPNEDLEEDKSEEIKDNLEDMIKVQKELQRLEKEEKGQSEPLTPLERPIILSGGRKWSRPDDAVRNCGRSKLTDEKIDLTLTSYYEVVTGHTIGINFMKFDPPPKNLDHLQKSEVYKLIHSKDPSPRGIIQRSEKLLAQEDYVVKSECI